jgi:cytolysin-activating lysine-acyltransferase
MLFKRKSKKTDNKEIFVPKYLSIESSLGVATLLAAKSKAHQNLSILDLETLIKPAILHTQFKIFRSPKNLPIAFISWAKLSDKSDKTIIEDTKNGRKLSVGDWNSGKNIWIMNVIDPFGIGVEALDKLNGADLKGQKAKIINIDPNKKDLMEMDLVDFIKEKRAAEENSASKKENIKKAPVKKKAAIKKTPVKKTVKDNK